MRDKLDQLKTDLFGAGLNPDGAGAQLYLKAQTISLAMIISVVVSLGAAGLYAPYSRLLYWTHAANALVYLGAYLAFRRNPNPTLIARVCCMSVFAVVFIVNVAYGGVMSPVISWFVLPALASALILSWREGWVWIGLGCLSVTALYVSGNAGFLPASRIPADILATADAIYAITFALAIGTLFSFWVARQRTLQSELHDSLERSKADTATARLFADSAAAANGSMDFAQAGRLCLKLVCEHQAWRAAQVWLAAPDGTLRSSGISYQSRANPAAWPLRFVPDAECPEGHTARIAMETAELIIALNLQRDKRFEACIDPPTCVLAWPVDMGGSTEIILEFFSDATITVDDDLRRILDHIGGQMAHVRLREKLRDHTEKMAFTDPVTRLPNRAGFEHLFERNLKYSKRDNTRLALMFVDLDGFKRVNDTLGHAVGDRLLREIGQRLEQHVRDSDVAAKLEPRHDAIAARLGGDEFTVVLTGVEDPKAVAGIARRFLAILSKPVDVGFQDVNIGASIGIAMYPDDGEALSELMRLADAAMYEAKALPGNQFRFATPDLKGAIRRRTWVETELQRALNQDELRVRYAPIAAALTGRVIANEVFLRWPHRDGEIAFEEFFPVAESSGLVAELGYWTIEKTCAAIATARWAEEESLKMCLDISLLNLQQPNFVKTVAGILDRYNTPRAMLEFEFADTSAILKNETCREHIRALHQMGIRIVLDRFGTGYSSLLDLARLPVWRIKLDRAFVEAVNIADGNRSMGRAIIAMAHSMGIETTIYGVENAAHAAWLKELGCDALQGDWVGRSVDEPRREIARPRIVQMPPVTDADILA
jgi:diguanylate cyclase (GGDEF)-like protein